MYHRGGLHNLLENDTSLIATLDYSPTTKQSKITFVREANQQFLYDQIFGSPPSNYKIGTNIEVAMFYHSFSVSADRYHVRGTLTMTFENQQDADFLAAHFGVPQPPVDTNPDPYGVAAAQANYDREVEATNKLLSSGMVSQTKIAERQKHMEGCLKHLENTIAEAERKCLLHTKLRKEFVPIPPICTISGSTPSLSSHQPNFSRNNNNDDEQQRLGEIEKKRQLLLQYQQQQREQIQQQQQQQQRQQQQQQTQQLQQQVDLLSGRFQQMEEQMQQQLQLQQVDQQRQQQRFRQQEELVQKMQQKQEEKWMHLHAQLVELRQQRPDQQQQDQQQPQLMQLTELRSKLQQQDCLIQDLRRQLADSQSHHEALHCKICFERPFEVVFVPCAHAVCCAQCSHGQNACPICRREIVSATRLIFS
jgi:hypothetical protein